MEEHKKSTLLEQKNISSTLHLSPPLSPTSTAKSPQQCHTILMTPPPQKHENLPPELTSRIQSAQSTDQIGKRSAENSLLNLTPPPKHRI